MEKDVGSKRINWGKRAVASGETKRGGNDSETDSTIRDIVHDVSVKTSMVNLHTGFDPSEYNTTNRNERKLVSLDVNAIQVSAYQGCRLLDDGGRIGIISSIPGS